MIHRPLNAMAMLRDTGEAEDRAPLGISMSVMVVTLSSLGNAIGDIALMECDALFGVVTVVQVCEDKVAV